jgi:sarcosine oxidase delta subunit
MAQQTTCPHCGEKENFHFNYDYTQKHMPLIDVMCNKCGKFFNMNKEDAKDGLYETWEEIEQEYMKDEYPVFGGPFTDALSPFEWLKKHYHPPKINKL